VSSVPIRILLGDGSPAALQNVRAFLEHEGFEVLATSSDRHELVDQAVNLRPTVVILDDAMPRARVLAAAREILNLCHETQLILLAQEASEKEIIEAFQAGIRGYVMNADAAPDLARAIREVSCGRPFLSHGASRRLAQAYVPPAPIPPPVPK
jgi:DNA-binding NarL/FixJ family response regulator